MDTIKVIFSGLVDKDEHGVKLGERYKAIPGFGKMFDKPAEKHTLDVSLYKISSGDLTNYLKCFQNGKYDFEKCPFGIIQLAIYLRDDMFVENCGDRVDIDAITDLSDSPRESKAFVLDALITSIKKDKGFKIVPRRQRPKWWSLLMYGSDDFLCGVIETPDQTITKRWRACMSAFAEHPLATFFWNDPDFRKMIVGEFHVSHKKRNSCLKNESLEDLKKWVAIQISPVSRSQVDKDVEAEATRLYNQRVGYLKQYTTPKSFMDVFDAESSKDIQHDAIWAECLRTAKSRITKKHNEESRKLNY